MRKILDTAHIYMIVGLVSGLYYRNITKAEDFTGDTQLAVVHTHVLALGMMFFLIVLALEKLFALTALPLVRWFFWTYKRIPATRTADATTAAPAPVAASTDER
ncbi:MULTISPECIES: DUF2871 family protein [unclassified Streptomyces]|uniref:DUF2871 family protein n=1 Tax=unclassified Streptomyces TaxID=2593676 RepID=UPI00093EE448|nr:DUF2871 family protein [Streptomyces sp. CB01883]